MKRQAFLGAGLLALAAPQAALARRPGDGFETIPHGSRRQGLAVFERFAEAVNR